jgi:hypothetical protein
MRYCLAAFLLVGLSLWAADAIVAGEPCKLCQEGTCPKMDKQKCYNCHEGKSCANCKAGSCKSCKHCKKPKAKKG